MTNEKFRRQLRQEADLWREEALIDDALRSMHTLVDSLIFYNMMDIEMQGFKNICLH